MKIPNFGSPVRGAKPNFGTLKLFQILSYPYIYFTSTIHVSSFKVKKVEFWRASFGETLHCGTPQFLLGLVYF